MQLNLQELCFRFVGDLCVHCYVGDKIEENIMKPCFLFYSYNYIEAKYFDFVEFYIFLLK